MTAAWIALPCSSWSHARHGPSGTSWFRIRDRAVVWGLRGLGPRAQATVDLGNKQLKLALSLISLCRTMSVPVYFENPGNSWVWATPGLQRLLCRPDAKLFHLDMCFFWSPLAKIHPGGRVGGSSARSPSPLSVPR